DRRVCEGRVREGAAADRRRAERGSAAPPAHPDDVVRLRAGLRAALDRQRGRIRCPADHGDHGDRRHDGGDPDRRLPNSRVVRHGGAPVAAPARRRGRARGFALAGIGRRSMNRAVRIAAAGVLAIGCSRCTVGPDYKRPASAVPPEYRGLPLEQGGPPEAASFGDETWWDACQDEAHRDLIRTAPTENYDVRIARTRI